MKISKLDLKPEIIDFLISEGYEELFEPQEEAVKAGLFDDKKNILVTIPTASGKTLIAMLATLSHLSKHKTKVVYLTPLRALTSEKFEEFKKIEKLNLGRKIKIALSTGDSKEKKEKLEDAKFQFESHQRDGNYTEASKFQYETIPDLEKTIEEHTKTLENTRFVKLEVTTEDIAEVISKWTGIPVNKMLEGEKEKLLQLENHLRNRVIGQEEALTKTSDVIRMSKMGVTDMDKPIGSFLFMGNTGVGKTELGKTLAEALFDDEKALVRIDMSELMESHSVSKLIGAPPGYVGYDEGGGLTEQIRRRPYSVILFDEIEKAHPSVLNILLQVLDDGRLTDSKGRTINFKNTIIIMTTNLSEDKLKMFLRPELRNRIDEIIKFNNLNNTTNSIESPILDWVFTFD